MISSLKFNKLHNQVAALTERVEQLEIHVEALNNNESNQIPLGMSLLSTLAAEYGISTKKAEVLARNTGVLLAMTKNGRYIAQEEKFHEAAKRVLSQAKRKYGSAYWQHPLIGKFLMSGGQAK
ncbi:hypothetical protein [Pantoea sp. SOD02]|uniref:hypothetical protein n=1 Tax=Pantoea sp. SOD02 TaxID=2970818 RepID=UPI002157B664|nr:hypothetical protein [Pantoea sp. SOD02]UVC29311.1 hypothetical protein NR302_19145 [Pantoea sp. SOD02]